jgi:WD40 repeat protein
MLKLLTLSLPRLIVKADLARQVKNVDVYQAFTDMWFEREMWKQLIQHQGIPPSENRVARYHSTAQQLSQIMFARDITTIPSAQFHLPLLGGLPILQQQGNLSFIHKSIQEFFTACCWIESLSSTSLALTRFGARLASSETGLLKFVAQMYDYTKHHTALLELVLASRKSNNQQYTTCTAAANAITILNSTRFIFSGIDLSGINIIGAILDGAIMHKTNLSHANLTDVSLRQACLDRANLSGASLLRVWFDHRSEITLPGVCCGMAATQGGFVTVTVNAYICEHTGRATRISTAETVSVAAAGSFVCVGTADGTIILWDLLTATPVFPPIKLLRGVVHCVAMSNSHIVSGGQDHSVCVCTCADGKLVRVLTGHQRKVTAIALYKQTIISGSADYTLRFWDLETGEALIVMETSHTIQCMVSYEGMLFTGAGNGTVQVWDISTGTTIKIFKGHSKGIPL